MIWTSLYRRLVRKVKHRTVDSTQPEKPDFEKDLPGSTGEHHLQEKYGTRKRALSFYHNQMLDRLNETMIHFIARQEMMFIATADGQGECDNSFRAGLPGFVQVLDEKHLLYPEYRGNGVMASLGNIRENPHMGILFIDFFDTAVGLHVNGKAHIVEKEELLAHFSHLSSAIQQYIFSQGKKLERWVLIEVEEAYIHCSKHIPRLSKLPKEMDWGTDDPVKKGGDYFQAKNESRPWVRKRSQNGK
ncbi:pyridoxamine 5'-phosphate oxidase family protein [Salinithrix halophila]|uniref:Pyridoxamine 5'-phosphate oxidase family protein n=1 Tax=Salinithrix halophila TaxID=1485204 RepID=A0ABV8JFC0_9BACL